jgi:UDP-N-acetylglucosamine diphosphorylase/glucosamine-1-phosphate N-acetyltransferase
MKILLHDNQLHLRFAPLTLTRPVGNLRMGIWTNDERWKFLLPQAEIAFATEAYLQHKFPSFEQADLTINAAVIPTKALAEAAIQLPEGTELSWNGTWLARKGSNISQTRSFDGAELLILENRWDLYQKNGHVLKADYALLTAGRSSEPLPASNTVIGDPKLIFLEAGASVEACILNTKEGPIYLGKDTEIMEGSLVRGPFALCDGAGVKMGAKIYANTTVGPQCRVGGEISNVIFQAFSNKGHDGFLGNSLIGEWCNLGADSNSSNLKNNYGFVKTYSYETGQMENTGVQFMGVTMGDHSKCGINTMFNTATTAGVSANIYGGNFPDKYIPSFTWGGAEGTVPFELPKAIAVAKAMMGRRHVEFTEGDAFIFSHLAGEKV